MSIFKIDKKIPIFGINKNMPIFELTEKWQCLNWQKISIFGIMTINVNFQNWQKNTILELTEKCQFLELTEKLQCLNWQKIPIFGIDKKCHFWNWQKS